MTIDKSWIKIRDRRSPIFLKGLNDFMELVKNYVDEDGKTRCPCKKCVNMCKYKLDLVYAHIFDHGFSTFYTVWRYLGGTPNYSDAAKQFANKTRIEANQVDPSDEMFSVIEDVMLEHSENTRASEQSASKQSAKKQSGLDPEFDTMFNELNTELYRGCSWMSSLSFIAKMMHIKAINKWTDSSFNQVLEFLKVAFPEENHIPASHYKGEKKLSKIGMGYKSIHVCKNDCALFYKDDDKLQNCPVCNESRWVDKDTKGKKVPQKVLRYFPLTDRLRRKYGSRKTAKAMIWHDTGDAKDGKMYHPVDAKEWQDFDNRYPEFSNEPRNVHLGLAADGFNPFGSMSLSYSMWPVVLTTYNTPPWSCMSETSFMLTMVIPGPKSPGRDIDVFLRPLVDELKELWKGVQIRDALTETVFKMRVVLLWTINDYPAKGSLS